jgi:hypothetical protein
LAPDRARSLARRRRAAQEAIMLRHAVRAGALGLCVAFVATSVGCGGNDSTDVQVDTGGGADTFVPGNDAGRDVVTPGDAGADVTTPSDGGTDAGMPRNFGTVSVTKIVITQGSGPLVIGGANARFPNMLLAGCTTETIGACIVRSCPAPTPDAGAPAYVSAGDITITSGVITAAMPAVMRQSDAGTYSYSVPPGSTTGMFAGGDMVRIQAAGAAGGVPPFDQTITAPSAPQFTAPMATAVDGLTVNRATDLTVTWMAFAAGRVVVTLTTPQITGGQPATTVECTYPGSAATGVVPSALLMRIPAGQGRYSFSSRNESVVTVGDWSLSITAQYSNGDLMGVPFGTAHFN